MSSARALGAWCGVSDPHRPHGMCTGVNQCVDLFPHPAHLGCFGRFGLVPPPPPQVSSRPLRCCRCNDDDDTVAARLLWGAIWAIRTGQKPVMLCAACNDLVQGPDYVELSGNLA